MCKINVYNCMCKINVYKETKLSRFFLQNVLGLGFEIDEMDEV